MKKRDYKELLKEEQQCHMQTMNERNKLLEAVQYSLERLNLSGGDMYMQRKLKKSLPPDAR